MPPRARSNAAFARSLTYVAYQTSSKTTAKELADNLEEAIAPAGEDHAETITDVMGLGVPILHGECASASPWLYPLSDAR
jgi:hypothetical protein